MSLSPFETLLIGWAVAAFVMVVLWLVERARRDAGVVDVGWAAVLGTLAVLYACVGTAPESRRLLVGVLGGVWGFRLAAYLLTNRVIGKEEDGRYQTLRARWGDRAGPRFFVFFQAQALLDVLLSIPFLLACFNATPDLHPLEYAGAGMWLAAIAGEALADRQLARFRADVSNRGRTCRQGLWRYSRHPNYFFEWLIWCAYALIALPAPYGWIGVACPLVMLFFILKVTGIPPTEAQALQSRGEAYREYQRTTSAFVPWFPKKEIC